MAKKKKVRANLREVEMIETLRRLGGSARNANLAQALGVSEETVRRTIKSLSKDGQLERVHGGAYLPDVQDNNTVYSRLAVHSAEKKAIADTAAALVRDNSTIFLDVGSTTAFVAEALAMHSNLTVVTNSLNAAQALMNRNGNRVFLAPGEMRRVESGTFGSDTLDYIRRFNIDTTILSVDGITASNGFLLQGADEAALSRCAIERARRTIVVADHSKFNVQAPFLAGAPEQVDVLVTDAPLPADISVLMLEAGVETTHIKKAEYT